MMEPNLKRIEAPDTQLERALASYVPAEAPAGLERRLAARLAAAAVVPRRQPAMFALAWAWAACSLFAVTLAMVAVHQYWQTGTDAKVQPSPVARPRSAGAQAEELSPPMAARRAAAMRPVHRAATYNPSEASLSEMRAPSRPAPQEPLTAEEKLLLRVVERRDPDQMAMLNPVIRATRAAESDREFQSFVDQSSTGNE